MRVLLPLLLWLFIQPSSASTAPAFAPKNRGFAIGSHGIWLIQPTEAAKLARLDWNGRWLGSTGIEEPGQPDSIVAPVEILTDQQGRCYVLDQAGPSIIVVSPEGKVLRRFGERGFERGQLRQPVDFGLDDHGVLTVLDLGREAVVRFTTQGQFAGEVLLDPEETDRIRWSKAIAVHPEGDFLLVSDEAGVEGLLRQFTRYSAAGAVVSRLTLGKIDDLGEITDVEFLPDGGLLIVDYQPVTGRTYTGAVYRFSAGASYEGRWFLRDPVRGTHWSPLRAKVAGGAWYVLTHTNLVLRIGEGGAVERSWGAGEL